MEEQVYLKYGAKVNNQSSNWSILAKLNLNLLSNSVPVCFVVVLKSLVFRTDRLKEHIEQQLRESES